MAFGSRYRLSVHAVISDHEGRLLLLRQTYGDNRWGLPGGGVDPGETVHQAIVRECSEELGCEVEARCLTGIYYHAEFESHVCIFRCELPDHGGIRLSAEHSEYRWTPLEELGPVQRQRVEECLAFDGRVRSAAFA